MTSCLLARSSTTWAIPLALLIFKVGSQVFAQNWPPIAILLCGSCSWDQRCLHHTRLINWDGLALFPGLASNLNLDLCFLSSCNYRCKPPSLAWQHLDLVILSTSTQRFRDLFWFLFLWLTWVILSLGILLFSVHVPTVQGYNRIQRHVWEYTHKVKL
jgi:hypothetical protein